LIDNYMEQLRQMQMESRLRDETGVKQVWERMKKQRDELEKTKSHSQSSDTSQDKQETDHDTKQTEEVQQEEQVNKLLENISIFGKLKQDKQQREEQVQKKMGAKNELHFLEKSAAKGREILVAFWANRADGFRNKWNSLSSDEKRKLLSDTRNFLLKMGNSSYANAVLYCPELHVEDLLAAAPSSKPDRIAFMELIDRCLADPAQRPDNFAENFLAPFVKQKLANTQYATEKERKEQENEVVSLAAMITISRRFTLLTFVCKVISEALGVPFDELAPATSLLAPLKATVPYLLPLALCDQCGGSHYHLSLNRSQKMLKVCSSNRRPTCGPARDQIAIKWKKRKRRSLCAPSAKRSA